MEESPRLPNESHDGSVSLKLELEWSGDCPPIEVETNIAYRFLLRCDVVLQQSRHIVSGVVSGSRGGWKDKFHVARKRQKRMLV